MCFQGSWNGEKVSHQLIQRILSSMHDAAPTGNVFTGYLCKGLVPFIIREVPEAMVNEICFFKGLDIQLSYTKEKMIKV